MVIIDIAPNGYLVRHSDAPQWAAVFVPTDELVDAVAALFDEGLTIYTEGWETMRVATKRRRTQGR